MDELAVPVLADQNIGFLAPIRQRKHELPPVPEHDDQVPVLPVQVLDRLGAPSAQMERLPNEPDQPGPDGRQQGELEPIEHSLTVSRSSPSTAHSRAFRA